MARASKAEQTGAIGINEVLGKFERIEFGHAELLRHDNGTDVFLLVRDARRFDLGLTMAAQVKGGESWFRRPAKADDGTLIGWWFEDSEGDHIDDWLSYGLPHLLVFYNVETSIAYWVQVIGDAVVRTGKGSKIMVPASQRVDPDSREALIAIAAAGRPSPVWEGSTWRGADSLPARDVLRHALLAPRLLAPHPNAHVSAALTAPQAIAMALQARIADLDALSERELVPAEGVASESGEWSWRLYAAIRARVTTGRPDALLAALASATSPAARAVAAAASAACLFEEDRADEAADVLEDSLSADDAEPVDHAWMSVQLARAYAQIGRIDEARALAASVQSVAATHSTDVTATAIGGVGANLLLSLQEVTTGVEEEVDAVSTAIQASDTAVTWWRQQVAGWATAASLDRVFIDWSRDRSNRWSRWDAANDQLLAASLNATLVGDHGAWAALTGLLGKDMLVRLDRRADVSRVHSGLSALRVAGRYQDLPLAVQRLVEDGPVSGVTLAAADVSLDLLTATSAQSSLMLLRDGGRTLDSELADKTVAWVVSTLANSSKFEARIRPRFLVKELLVEVLAGVLPAASEKSQQVVADYIAHLDPLEDDLLAKRWIRVATNIDPHAWTEQQANAVAARHDDATLEFRDTLVARLARRSAAARDAAIDAVRERADAALSGWGDVRTLPDDVVEELITLLIEMLAARRAEVGADEGHQLWAYDRAHALTVLNVHWHDKARWQPLIDYLADPRVPARDKARSFATLAGVDSVLRSDHAAGLLAAAEAVRDLPKAAGLFDGSRSDIEGSARLFLATYCDATLPIDVPLALASVDATDRIYAARMAWYAAADPGTPSEGVLLVLAQDDNPRVRATATAGLAALAARRDSDPVLEAALDNALKDPGLLVPQALATCLGETEVHSSSTQALLSQLCVHPLSYVRNLARDIVKHTNSERPESTNAPD